MLDPCPHCGSKNGFMVKAYAGGKVERIFGPDGRHLEDWTDALFFEDRGVVRCVDCIKIISSLGLKDFTIITKAAGLELAHG